MPTTTNMKMVNGRVDEQAVAKATRTLKSRGLTVSAFIRNSIEHVAKTGEVPESGFPQREKAFSSSELQALVAKLEAKKMPGKADYAETPEDDLVNRLRLERYGY